MQIIRISPRGFGANTYVLTEDNKNAIVIDPAQPRIAQELANRGLNPQFVLLTHCHFDHVMGVEALQAQGAKVYCSAEEKPLFNTSADLFDLFGAPRLEFALDGVFADGEEKELCGITVKALLTPGHTKGSVCYLMTANDGGRYLFTGDTLFQGTIGRTDFPTGDMLTLKQSLRTLATFEDDLPVYPGHNDETTIGQEKRENPFMD